MNESVEYNEGDFKVKSSKMIYRAQNENGVAFANTPSEAVEELLNLQTA